MTASIVGKLLSEGFNIPEMEGETIDENGLRKLNGILLNPVENTVYRNKYCHVAGNYGQCRATNCGSYTWVGGTYGCRY